MGILVGRDTRVLVQGITGREGFFHTEKMLEYGTRIVAGVTPGKGGSALLGVPVFNTVREAIKETEAVASVIFVPAASAADAILEGVDAGLKVLVCITEGIPVRDMIKVKHVVDEAGVVLIGPNCPGIITAGQAKLGIMPENIFTPGEVGLVSRSGTLTYQVVDELTRASFGQTTCVGIGGDPILGATFKDILKFFAQDRETSVVVLIGEIGGIAEEEAAEFIKKTGMRVVAFVAGKTAPPGKRMGHAGAIVSGTSGTAKAKIEALQSVGVPVAETTAEIVKLVSLELARNEAAHARG